MIKLSPYQEIFYNEWKLNPQRSDYNIIIDNELFGQFSRERLQNALNRLSGNYFLLQSGITETVEGCYWVEQPEVMIDFDYIDIPQTELELLSYVKTPFNLETGPLLRVRLIKLKEMHFRLLIVIHHVIMDGAKIKFIFNAISRYYNDPEYLCDSSVLEQQQKLALLSSLLERKIISNEDHHLDFWRTQLTDLSCPDLHFLKNQLSNNDLSSENSVGEYLFVLDENLLRQIQCTAKTYKITPFILSQIIFATLLYRHTSQKQFGICVPYAIKEGMNFIYGTHVSPIIIPYHFNHSISLKNIIENIRNYWKLMKNSSHYYFPLQKILQTFVSKEIMSVGFSQTDLKNEKFDFFGITHENINTSLNIDLPGKLLFSQEVKGSQIFYRVLYQKKDIDSDLLLSFIQTYQTFLAEVLKDLLNGQDDRNINDYPLLTKEQYNLLTIEWNQTDRYYPSEKALQQLFEEQVVKTPDAVAITYEDISLSYEDLNQQANQLAHYIKAQVDIQPGDLIVLCIYPSHHMIVALWAVLKVGAAYVPIDPTYPEERIAYLLNDTQTKLLIVDQTSLARLAPLCQMRPIFLINIENNFTWCDCPKVNLECYTQPHHLAYMIYTSGTTGQPKGVLIEHHSVVNYISYLINYHQLSNSSVGVKYASFSFDASVIEIYPILLSGGKLCIMNEADRLDCEVVNDFFEKNKVTYAFLSTAFAMFFCELKNSSLKNLMVGGEEVKKINHQQTYRITNAYGPTEATVQSTYFIIGHDQLPVPIGKPIQNTKCYIVDAQSNLCPIGVIGELWIAGEGLARGYLNNALLTQEKFSSNPFQTAEEKFSQKNKRIYKTGDLVRWLPNGELEYIGRNDSQVKIRGYRIELGEIENQLMQYDNIQHACVIVIDSIVEEIVTKILVAYYVSDIKLDEAEIRKYLLKYLPEFMIPTLYVFLSKLPVKDVTGKIDKSLLPKPILPTIAKHTPPIRVIEKKVCMIYEKTLGLSKNSVGMNDGFFQLGGNSLTAIYLARQLSQHFTILVTDIFRLETPANIIRELLPTSSPQQQVQKIKILYDNMANILLEDWTQKDVNSIAIQNHKHYLENNRQLYINVNTKKEIDNVLLTGVTGHLGCNLLEKLLTETSYTIYLPVRAPSDHEAYLRVEQKFKYYFEQDLSYYNDRIVIFAASLEDKELGLSADKYHKLTTEIHSTIHCAALVKYYSNYDEFYLSNVQTTANLLALTQLTSHPDFHYISTLGVLVNGYIEDHDYYVFNEDDPPEQFINGIHPYACSKQAAERLVIESRNRGISGTIYRVGNLAMHSTSYRIQQDFRNNFFFCHIKTMLQFGIVPIELTQFDISPVDHTALAVVRLFDKFNLVNQTYHVFNHHRCDLGQIIRKFTNIDIDDFELFVKKVLNLVEQSETGANISHLLTLYQFWLQETNEIHSTTVRISSQRTRFILEQLNFNWAPVTAEMLVEFINKSI